MADAKLERLVQQAETAYQKRDKRKGAQLIDDVLRKDFNYPSAWTLLYRLFGGSRDFNDFRRAFTLQYYPDRIGQLKPIEQNQAAEPEAEAPVALISEEMLTKEKKPGFFARLFGIFRRKPKPTPQALPGAGETPAEPLVGEAATPRPVNRVSSLPTASPLASRPLEDALVKHVEPAPAAPVPQAPSRPTSMVQPAQIFNKPEAAQAPGSKYKIHVIVVDDIPQTRETVIRSLRFQEDISVDGTATNGIQAIQLVKELRPDVVVMDVNMPDMDGITATAIIKKEAPYAEIIILTVQDDVDYIRRAMNAGARDFLAKPPIIEELIAAVQRAGAIAKRARESFENAQSMPQHTAATPAARGGKGKIITIFSPRGGSGCTTLAVNLAVALHTPETRVAVVDGNLQYGDVAVSFNLQPKNNILDLTPRVDELDVDLVEEVMAEHSSGVKVLATARPERAELVTGPQFSALLSYLSDIFPYVIVDTSRRLNDVTLAAIDSCDVLALVASQDIPSIWRMRKFLDMLPGLNFNPKRILMIMNQFDQRVSIDPEKVGQAFGHPVAAVIPSALNMAVNASNKGEPFMLTSGIGTQPLGRGILNFVDALKAKLEEVEKIDTQAVTR